MLLHYHRALTGRADAAAVSGDIGSLMTAMACDAVFWALPGLLAVAICWTFGLAGVSALWVSLPLIAISIFGCVFYVGTVYALAITRRANGS
ncbi:MAG: hypothetical protein PSY12_13660 [bacterium]|nr:hypothetical protein [bacterium]